MITISITGHTNIEKACGLPMIDEYGHEYNPQALKEVYSNIERVILSIAEKHNIDVSNITLASGMARGVDEVFALFAIKNDMPLILCVPNSLKWHRNRDLSRGIRSQAIFYNQITRYSKIVSINEIKKQYNGKEYKYGNFARNQNLVDVADYVISYKCYDSTGTDDCIKRAELAEKYLLNVPNVFDDW